MRERALSLFRLGLPAYVLSLAAAGRNSQLRPVRCAGFVLKVRVGSLSRYLLLEGLTLGVVDLLKDTDWQCSNAS